MYSHYAKLSAEISLPESSSSDDRMTPKITQKQATSGTAGLEDEVAAVNVVPNEDEESSSSLSEDDIDEDGEDETENDSKAGTRNTIL